MVMQIDSIPGLDQNEASLSEAEEARRLTNETMKQGRIIMIFTTATVLFVSRNHVFKERYPSAAYVSVLTAELLQLPPSFTTSLFSLNVTVFPHQADNLLYKARWIFPIIC